LGPEMRLTTITAAVLALCLVALGCSNDPYPPAGEQKVRYGQLGEDPQTLDPVKSWDTLSGGIIAQIYDPLYQYSYLKRPYQLEPCLAAEMPEVSPDGLTYTIRIKQGVFFQDDPCFQAGGGKGRELVADDFVFSIKRLCDQGTDTTGYWTLQGKVAGLDAFYDESGKRAAEGKRMDYSMPVEGLQAPDRYTLRIKLTKPYPQLKYILAMTYTAAVPNEAVEDYGKDFVNHPVGTGAFRLKEWTKRYRMILARNPTYRDERYPDEGEPGDREAGLLADAGKRLPLVDEFYLPIVTEDPPAWIMFKQGYLDASGITKDNFKEAISPTLGLTAEFREKGITLTKAPEESVYYVGFNMSDPVVGPNSKLRQAMSLAYDTEWRIKYLYDGRAIPAQGPIPPGIFGYDPDYKDPYKEYDPEKASKLLAEAGYPRGVGKDGRQLSLTYDLGSADLSARQFAERFRSDMAAIGINVNIQQENFSEYLRKAQQGSLQVFSAGWILDYPDPQDFLQLFYGPFIPKPNDCRYDNPEYNKLYEQMEGMPDTPERLAIIRRMVDMVVQDAVWIPSTYSINYTLRQSWLKNSKPNDLTAGFMKYSNVDVALREKLRKEWNPPNYTALAVIVGVLLVGMVSLAFVRRAPRGGR
jgi:oligopeptide transport system substrate-binding protein